MEQTKEHVERLKQVLRSLEEKPSGKKCPGMVGILQEGEEMMGEDYEGAVMDAALISAAQRVEHYEIAAYGCVHTWAQELGEDDAAELLEMTLNEEKETDAKLTDLAQQINASARKERKSWTKGRKKQKSRKSPRGRASLLAQTPKTNVPEQPAPGVCRRLFLRPGGKNGPWGMRHRKKRLLTSRTPFGIMSRVPWKCTTTILRSMRKKS